LPACFGAREIHVLQGCQHLRLKKEIKNNNNKKREKRLENTKRQR